MDITDSELAQLQAFIGTALKKLSQDDTVIDLFMDRIKNRNREMLRFIPINDAGLRAVVYTAFEIIQKATTGDEFDVKLKLLAGICIRKEFHSRPPFESCADYLYWILEKVNADEFSADLRLVWLKTIHFCICRIDIHIQSPTEKTKECFQDSPLLNNNYA